MSRDSLGVRPLLGRSLLLTVCGVVAVGACALLHALLTLDRGVVTGGAALLALLVLVVGRLAVHVPGYPATVSVSEFFVFILTLLFGPAPAVLTVGLDGLFASLAAKRRCLHRTLFNVAEPAISVWAAGHAFFALLPGGPLARGHVITPDLLLPTAAMAATYFLCNTVLTAVALSLESGHHVAAVWRRYAPSLAINYFGAASLASLAVVSIDGLNFTMIGLGLPLVALSYVACKAVSERFREADTHVRHTDSLYSATVEMLAIAVDAKDRVTHGHVRRVQRHTVAVARALGINGESDLKAIEAASLLHDVGKIAIPDHVLNKPGTLGAAEYARIKTHANIGAMIVKAVDFPYPIAPIVKHHHENWDGTGYPDKLAGTEIPVGARIIAVVDCFDALTSDRPYRRAMTDAAAVAILQERRGRMYDPDVVDEFIRTLPELRRADEEADGRAPAFAAITMIEDVAAAPSLTAADETDRTLGKLRASGPDLAERIRRVVTGVEVCLFGVDAETGRLVLAHATPRVRAVAAAADLRVGDGLSGWVAANCSTIANSDPSLDFGDRARELELRSCLSIPVFGVGSVAGVLSVYDARAEAFSGNDVRVLESFAQESIAHDFNNILTAVIGNLQFATLGADFNDETAEALAAAERACGRATGLAKQLQMFSKGSAPAKAALSLPELIRDCTQFALRGSDVACEYLIADDLWQAHMDSAELSRVVHNLVINAKQATPPGGTIRVQCSNVSHAPSTARALPLPPGPYVALSITDEGVGMPAEHLATIFDPRSVRADTGSRPNLAPSHSIVSAHGGHVAVSSTVGQGTRFVVHLPASLEPAVQPATTTAATLGTTSGRRVLVVDDEEEIRKVAVRLLKRLGYAPDAVSDGGMALTRYADAQKDGRPFDIVLLDLAIPGGMGALETIERLRRIDPGVKAIVSSGYSDSTAMVDFDRFGFEGVIAKPYALAEFKATFGRLADMPVSNGQVMAFSSALRPASTATASLAG